jgi:hypothetical protein
VDLSDAGDVLAKSIVQPAISSAPGPEDGVFIRIRSYFSGLVSLFTELSHDEEING